MKPNKGFPQFWSKKRRSVTLQPSRGRLDKSEQSSVTLVVTSSADLSLPPAYRPIWCKPYTKPCAMSEFSYQTLHVLECQQ
jgi:hypothetical protein